MVELGISTFGETTALEATGQIYSHDERIRQLVAEIELADKVGLYRRQRLFLQLGQSIPRRFV